MQVLVKETTVYTLAELQEQFGERIYDKAIDNIISQEWECFEPEIITEDMAYCIGEDFPLFEMAQSRIRTGSKDRHRPHLYWDMNPYSAECKGTVDVERFMRANKLRRKYALLAAIMRKYGLNQEVGVGFGIGSAGDCDLSDLVSEIEYESDIDYDKPRYAKLLAQIEGLQADIDNYVSNIYSWVLKYLREEEKYRSSEEYAKEEAEALELQFTEEGRIYHG